MAGQLQRVDVPSNHLDAATAPVDEVTDAVLPGHHSRSVLIHCPRLTRRRCLCSPARSLVPHVPESVDAGLCLAHHSCCTRRQPSHSASTKLDNTAAVSSFRHHRLPFTRVTQLSFQQGLHPFVKLGHPETCWTPAIRWMRPCSAPQDCCGASSVCGCAFEGPGYCKASLRHTICSFSCWASSFAPATPSRS